jgi:osmotically-inducible protein OsmY
MKSAILIILCGAAVAGCQSGANSQSAQSDQSYSSQGYSNQAASSTAGTASAAENAGYSSAPASSSTSTYSSTSGYSSAPTTNPDNTAINARDRDPNLPTADNQGQSRTDIDLTSAIRRGILERKLSINAQNVKIITLNGRVTLRGPVNSADEKQAIGQVAGDVAGQGNVDNELDVTPNS